MADPHDPDPRLGLHGASCHDCDVFAQRLLSFESRLERALRVDVPAVSDSASGRVVPLRAQSRPSAVYRKGWMAMAASLLLAVAVAGVLWLAAPNLSLAAAVVVHMGGEPQAWRKIDVAVPSGDLEEVLRDSHLRLATTANLVSYASRCGFRGYHVPHLVIQTKSGPVTVMVLVHERVSKEVRFDEGGYRGVIVPVAGHGSLAVLTRGPAADIESVASIAARVLDSIVWTG